MIKYTIFIHNLDIYIKIQLYLPLKMMIGHQLKKYFNHIFYYKNINLIA